MLPHPLHPAVVHFPIVLVVFLPIALTVSPISAAGLAGEALGRAGRVLDTVSSVGLDVVSVPVRAVGADVVYSHGAASALYDHLQTRAIR